MTENKEIITRTSKIWLEDGIIRASYIDNVEETLEDAKRNVQALYDLSEGKLYPALLAYSRVKSQTRECRQYYAGPATAKVLKAAAILTTSPLSKILANFFLGINRPLIPTRLFTSEREGLSWLSDFVEQE